MRSVHRPQVRSRPWVVVIVAVMTVLFSAAVCVAAVLAPAPAAALPLVVVVCIGCPLFAAWELPVAVGSLRASRAGAGALTKFRQTLEQLPETEHPLGL